MTPADILAYLRAHPEDAPEVAEGLRNFAEWHGDTLVFPLIVEDDDSSLAMVGHATPAEGSPAASAPPPWIKAQVWGDPSHESWHSTHEDACAAVDAHLTANGWTVLPRSRR